MFSISFRKHRDEKKEKKLVNFDYQKVNSHCSCHHYVNSSCNRGIETRFLTNQCSSYIFGGMSAVFNFGFSANFFSYIFQQTFSAIFFSQIFQPTFSAIFFGQLFQLYFSANFFSYISQPDFSAIFFSYIF